MSAFYLIFLGDFSFNISRPRVRLFFGVFLFLCCGDEYFLNILKLSCGVGWSRGFFFSRLIYCHDVIER